MSLAKQLNALLERNGMTHLDLAKAIGVSRQAVQTWSSGRAEPRAAALSKICAYFKVSPEWLQGEDPLKDAQDVMEAPPDGIVPPGFVAIPEYSLSFHCTPGGIYEQTSWEEKTDSRPAIYPNSFFLRWRTVPEKCKRVAVSGDSMEPVLFDGDVVTIREEVDPHIVDGAVYAICVFDDLKIKRLYKKADKSVILHSDNERYPEETISGDDLNYFHVIGRVIDRQGHGGLG